MNKNFDLIVVGLGAMGSAALYHSATKGLRVLGIDRHDPPHKFGSSHAETRVSRLAVGEGPQYLPFVARSHEIWRDLERQTGETIFHQTGGYIITPAGETTDDRWGSFVHRTVDVAATAGIEFEVQSADEVMAHQPNLILQDHEIAGYEPTGGVVMCERAVAVQLRLARNLGAQTVVNSVVHQIEPDATGVWVRTHDREYRADSVIVTTGAWFPELAPRVDADAVQITRQVVYWFEVDDPASYATNRFPFQLWAGETIADYSGVFPIPPGGNRGLKVLGEQFHETTTAETVQRTVTTQEVDEFYETLVIPRLRGVRRDLVDAAVCLYTNTADDHFLIDTHPDSERVLFASPCSGHGFKHSSGLGEAMVAAVTGAAGGLDISPFVRKS